MFSQRCKLNSFSVVWKSYTLWIEKKKENVIKAKIIFLENEEWINILYYIYIYIVYEVCHSVDLLTGSIVFEGHVTLRVSVWINICLCFAWEGSTSCPLVHTSIYTPSTLLSQQSSKLSCDTLSVYFPHLLWKHTMALTALHQQPHWSKTLTIQLNLEQAPATAALKVYALSLFVCLRMCKCMLVYFISACVRSVRAYSYPYSHTVHNIHKSFVFSLGSKLHLLFVVAATAQRNPGKLLWN